MAKTIKEVLDDLGYNSYGIDQALAEIKRIIEEAKPKYASGYNKGIEHYHKNLLKALEG